jgi:transposase
MQILPAKNYNALSGLNQLCLPMDVGVLIPQDDSVRLLAFVLKQLDLKPLYEAYDGYGERRRREDAARKREGEERGAGDLVAADERESADSHQCGGPEKKKAGRPPCDILVLLRVVVYGYMQGVYSTRDLARACRQNINFMWLLNGSPPPSHGMLHAFRKHVLGASIEKLFYNLVRFPGRSGDRVLRGRAER